MSKKYCCVPGCAGSENSHPVLHVFPNPEKDPDRFRLWVLAVGGDILGLDNNWIYKNRRVCHQHFVQQYCYYSNKLSPTAVPTQNLPGPSNIPKFTFSEHRRMKDIQNIEKDSKPSTSKASGLFDMDIDNEDQEVMQSLASTAEKSDKIDIMMEVIEERPCEMKIPDLSFETPSLQYLTVPVLERTSNIDLKTSSEGPSTDLQHSVAKTVPVLERNLSKTSSEGPSTDLPHSVAKTGKRKLKSFSKQEQVMYKKIRLLQIKLSRCRSEKKKVAKSMKMAQNVMTNQSFLKTVENMTSAGRALTLLQFREQKKKGQGRRFTLKEKIMALSIYKQSPKAYRFLRKILLLPATQTLDKLVQKATIAPLYDEKLFKQLKEKARKMKDHEKLFVLLFDEVALQAYINYNNNDDQINGLVDDGNNVKFANHALVFMLRGLIKNFKQPIAYMFCSGATNATLLKNYIVNIIQKVEEAGFRIIATVCDQGTNNQKAIKSLVEEYRSEKLRHGEELKQNIFKVNESEIIPLYDPPHLLKGIRNNLMQKDLIYTNEFGKECKGKWEHIEKLYAENPTYKGLRMIPKLTEQHVIKEKVGKMRVKFASQVFSQTVGLVMGYLAEKNILPAECQDTADLLIFFDKLFDSMNASYGKKGKHGKPYLHAVTSTSVHNELWHKSKKILSTMKFTDKSGKTRTTPTLNNFIWTIDGILYLVKKLADLNISSLWTRHLNQDPLENFFGSIRSHGCRNTNPSPAAFQSAYTALLINNLSSVHAAGNNCEEDFCEGLEALVLNPIMKNKETCVNKEFDLKHLLINLTPLSEKQKNVKEIASLTYVSGFFLKVCKKRIFKKCETCNTLLFNKNKDNEYLKYREYSGRSWLCYPCDNFISLISAIQDIFYEIINDKFCSSNLLHYIRLVIDFHININNFIECKKHRNRLTNFLYNYTLRFFITNYCKDINKILSGRKKKNVNNYLENQAELYYKKSLKIKKK